MNGALGTRRSFIVNTLLGVSFLCVVGLWLFESSAGLLSDLDRYGYPYLLLLFSACFLSIVIAPASRYRAEVAAYIGVAIYFIAALFSFAVFPSESRVYTVANTLQWMPVNYVAAFIMFRRRLAMAAAGTVFVLSLLPCLAIAIHHGARYWDVTIGALLINAYVVHLLILLSLSLVGMLHDQFEQASSMARRMESAALTDGLMGIANRRGIEQALKALRGSGRPVGLILLDMDNFKSINDRFGHLVGDELLILMARRIGEKLSETDLLGRWGGEELLVVSAEPGLPALLQLAERIRLTVEEAGHPIAGPATLSAGVTVWNTDLPVEDALRLADRALYQAKLKGRNRVEAI